MKLMDFMAIGNDMSDFRAAVRRDAEADVWMEATASSLAVRTTTPCGQLRCGLLQRRCVRRAHLRGDYASNKVPTDEADDDDPDEANAAPILASAPTDAVRDAA